MKKIVKKTLLLFLIFFVLEAVLTRFRLCDELTSHSPINRFDFIGNAVRMITISVLGILCMGNKDILSRRNVILVSGIIICQSILLCVLKYFIVITYIYLFIEYGLFVLMIIAVKSIIGEKLNTKYIKIAIVLIILLSGINNISLLLNTHIITTCNNTFFSGGLFNLMNLYAITNPPVVYGLFIIMRIVSDVLLYKFMVIREE